MVALLYVVLLANSVFAKRFDCYMYANCAANAISPERGYCIPCSQAVDYSVTCVCKRDPGVSDSYSWGFAHAATCRTGYYALDGKCLLNNCASMNTKTTCGYCNRGYYLTNNNEQCIKCAYPCGDCYQSWCNSCINSSWYVSPSNGVCTIVNCAGMNGTVCSVCKEGYYLKDGGMKCEKCTPPCATCSGPKTCTGCIEMFTLQGTTCGIQNCAVLENLKCKTCDPGYMHSLDSVECIRCSPNCATCKGSSDICQSCPKGLQLDSATKKCVVQNCLRMSGNICVECISGYYTDFTGTTCLLCTKPCKTCRGFSNWCTSCEKDYVLFSSSCMLFNCTTMSGLKCDVCENGFYLTAEKTCAKCDATCSQCLGSATTCTACPNGLQRENGKCKVPNCDTMDGTTCTKCTSGFFATSPTSCQRCKFPCAECSESPTRCTNCAGNTLLTNFECRIQNCAIMNGSTCERCNNGYFATSGRKECHLCAANCATCSDKNTTCTSCSPDKMLDTKSNQCVTPNCDKMVSNVCLDCAPGHYPNPNGNKCLPCTPPCKDCLGAANMCVACSSSYTLNAARCVVENCLTMNGEGCAQCYSGYYNFGPLKCEKCEAPCQECAGSASSCTSCSYQYNLANKKCVVPNCETMSGTTCKTCKEGYYLTSGDMQCLLCTAPCATCSGSGTSCTGCKPGYEHNISEKTCVIPQCRTMLGTRCTLCNRGYYLPLDGSTCLKCTTLCDTCLGTQDICLSCNSSYTFSSYACIVQNCAKMNGTACQECIQGYYLSGPLTCLLCQSPCATCSSSATQCTSCSPGYALVGGICAIPNCKTMSGLTCVECQDGYYSLGNGMFCFKCMEGCATCERSPNMCTSCSPGYQMVGNSNQCYMSNCSQCINGKCSSNSMTQEITCQCPNGFILIGGTCIHDICGTCTNGMCKLASNFTKYCDCGKDKKLFNGNCIPNTCGPCTGGTCSVSNDMTIFECQCPSTSLPDGTGSGCLLRNKAFGGLSGGEIAAIVIFGTIGVILILLTIILPIKYCCNRDSQQHKVNEMDSQFSSFERFSNGPSSYSSVGYRQQARI